MISLAASWSDARCRDGIPKRYDTRLGVAGFVAQNAERGRSQRKVLPFNRRRPDPSRGEDAPELAMREERDVAFQRLKLRNEPTGAGGNLRRRFTAGAAIPE